MREKTFGSSVFATSSFGPLWDPIRAGGCPEVAGSTNSCHGREKRSRTQQSSTRRDSKRSDSANQPATRGALQQARFQHQLIPQTRHQQRSIQQARIYQKSTQLSTIGPGSNQHKHRLVQISGELHASGGSGPTPEVPNVGASHLDAAQYCSIPAHRGGDCGGCLPSEVVLLARVHAEPSTAQQVLANPAFGQQALDGCAPPRPLATLVSAPAPAASNGEA